jgi:1,4-dihydroxy-2-naphthoate octaprenyltransferase
VATAAQWVQGARPRTLPAALAPVIAGTGVANAFDALSWSRALLCLVVAMALQVAVNYANDYSDGIRGTDDDRVGPLRLVGSGVASPGAVKRAAFIAFAVGAVAGLALAAQTSWWLVLVGAVSILAAWGYTGGPRPYGYAGLGEVFVFVFFGLVAVCGTAYVQIESFTVLSVVAAVPIGMLACAILVANNLRDLPSDAEAGKRTLAVRLGDGDTRALYSSLLLLPFVVPVALYGHGWPWGLLPLGAFPIALYQYRHVRSGVSGPELVPVLKATGLTELVFAVLFAIALAFSPVQRVRSPCGGSALVRLDERPVPLLVVHVLGPGRRVHLLGDPRCSLLHVSGEPVAHAGEQEVRHERADRERQDDEQDAASAGGEQQPEGSDQHSETRQGVDDEGSHERPKDTADGRSIYSRQVTRALPLLLLLGFLVYCLVDCLQTPEERVKNLPKVVWIILILIIPVVGGVVWLVAGHAWGSTGSGYGGSGGFGSGGGRGTGGRGGTPRAPDDDDDFLRGLP